MDHKDDPELDANLTEAILNSWNSTWEHSPDGIPLSEKLCVLPVLKRPLFPGMITSSISIEHGLYYDAIKAIMKGHNKSIVLVLAKSEDLKINEVTPKDLHKVGVIAEVMRVLPTEQGNAQVIFSVEKRCRIDHFIEADGQGIPLIANVSIFKEPSNTDTEIKALSLCIISVIRDLLKLSPIFKDEMQILSGHYDSSEPGKLADLSAAFTSANRAELQEILETFDLKQRMIKSLIILNKELDLNKIQHEFNKKVEASIAKTQKEFFLREQMKIIKKELGGDKDDKTLDRDKFNARISNYKVPEHVQKVIKEEMDKMDALEPHSPEYGVVRNYLEWLTNIPWGIHSTDNHNLNEAELILENDHFGLHDIKQRILEHIAVGSLVGEVRSTILCLVGPPGVGKTSIGKSIARALGRKFYRFSVGGMRDEAEIKGHRRTYIGAMPGKILQALKNTQTVNPVIMIDEVDKMHSGYHGDPASALLEVLDPEQNVDFLDHYLDVRCDLSGILFIATANTLDTIPEALKDRMEVLRLSGYIAHEKLQIAKKYLIPRHRKEMGLKASQVSFTDEAITKIINQYAREAGVRSLENHVKKILRKVALKIARNSQDSNEKKSISKCQVSMKNLVEYLGKPKFTSDRFYPQTPVGVCTGLAWTSMGGATLYVECIKVKAEQNGMELTGQAGDVMKESARIAWSYLHSAAPRYAPTFTFFEKTQVHIHIPEGATPKDGPSAGITLVTALLSLLMNTPVTEDLGMTGELTLTGRVLPVGGIKEKLVAARRSGLKTLILPSENIRDVEELASDITDGLSLHYVDHYDQVFSIAFPEQ